MKGGGGGGKVGRKYYKPERGPHNVEKEKLWTKEGQMSRCGAHSPTRHRLIDVAVAILLGSSAFQSQV